MTDCSTTKINKSDCDVNRTTAASSVSGIKIIDKANIESGKENMHSAVSSSSPSSSGSTTSSCQNTAVSTTHTGNMSPPISVGVSSSTSPSSSTSKTTVDTLFEPSIEMMLNDFDDERTLEEEEALAATEQEDPSAELSSLQREGDMPIEELLALYNCAAPSGGGSGGVNVSSINAEPSRPRSSSSSNNENESISEEQNEEKEEEKEPSELRKLYPEFIPINDQRLLRTLSRQSEEEDDGDYNPDDDEYKKTIMVGSEFQAPIPEGLCRYDDALPYENEDKLLWDPTKLIEMQIEDYLEKAKTVAQCQSTSSSTNPTTVLPLGKHLRDDEQALFLLLQCGHNTDEALRRRRINAVTCSDAMSLWSEEECRNFENGLRLFGKDFHSIQQSKVRTRSVGELVQFYYLWKKTERHDVFANKARLEKKKYSLQPGLTDYMDRFLEEHEGNGNNIGGNGVGGSTTTYGHSGTMVRDRSSSPGVNSLLYADSKRQRQSSIASFTTASAVAATHYLNPQAGHHANDLHRRDPFADIPLVTNLNNNKVNADDTAVAGDEDDEETDDDDDHDSSTNMLVGRTATGSQPPTRPTETTTQTSKFFDNNSTSS